MYLIGPKLLLHVCCAPCSTHVINELKKEYSLTAYFYNPNIHPEVEYSARLDEMRSYARRMGLKLLEGSYDVYGWFNATKGYENEKEGGRRCEICYALRMEGTASLAKENNFDYFATTLSISPHKKSEVINSIGEKLAEKYGVKFHSADFKKRDGFKKSVEMCKELGLYRQSYCGCIFSREERERSSQRASTGV